MPWPWSMEESNLVECIARCMQGMMIFKSTYENLSTHLPPVLNDQVCIFSTFEYSQDHMTTHATYIGGKGSSYILFVK